MDKKFEIKLSFNEIMTLDGKVSDETQLTINKIKEECGFGFKMPIINEILLKSKEIGKLTWANRPIRSCEYCDKKYTYKTYPRSSKYHDKGDYDHNRPIYYSGIKFNEGAIIVRGSGDMCHECMKKNNVLETIIDYIINNDLKIEIQKNDYRMTKYIKDPIKICPDCNERVRESKMGELPALMGGRYKGVCPECGYKQTIASRIFKSTAEFDFILNPVFGQEVVLSTMKNMIKQFNDKNEFNIQLNLFESFNKINYYIVEMIIEKTDSYAFSFDLEARRYKIKNDFKYNYDEKKFGVFIEALKHNGYKQYE